MGKKKGIQVNSMIKDAKAQEWGYMIDGKKVSEFKFFNQIKREFRGDKIKKQFYWTDEKVRLLLGCFKIEITDSQLNDFKKQVL